MVLLLNWPKTAPSPVLTHGPVKDRQQCSVVEDCSIIEGGKKGNLDSKAVPQVCTLKWMFNRMEN